MRKAIIFIAFILSVNSFSQNNQTSKAMDFINNSKFDSAFTIVNKIGMNSPEYFVLMINLYLKKSTNDYVEIGKGKPTRDSAFLLSDSTGKQVGYLKENIEYNLDTLNKGISILQTGISKFPDRLDMRFGLVYVQETAKLYSAMILAMEDILNQSVKNHNNWLWSLGEKKEDGKQFMLENVQTRANMLFNLAKPHTDSLFVEISEALIKSYPDCVYGYNNLGAYYAANKDYKRGLVFLYKANKINPTDPYMIGNIGEINKRMGNKTEALKYYKLLDKYGDSGMKKDAQTMINELSR